MQIPELQKILDFINSQSKVKQNEIMDLKDRLKAAKVKEMSNESIILERRRQIQFLENKGRDKLASICTSSMEKDQDIHKLGSKLDEIRQTDYKV